MTYNVERREYFIVHWLKIYSFRVACPKTNPNNTRICKNRLLHKNIPPLSLGKYSFSLFFKYSFLCFMLICTYTHTPNYTFICTYAHPLICTHTLYIYVLPMRDSASDRCMHLEIENLTKSQSISEHISAKVLPRRTSSTIKELRSTK